MNGAGSFQAPLTEMAREVYRASMNGDGVSREIAAGLMGWRAAKQLANALFEIAMTVGLVDDRTILLAQAMSLLGGARHPRRHERLYPFALAADPLRDRETVG